MHRFAPLVPGPGRGTRGGSRRSSVPRRATGSAGELGQGGGTALPPPRPVVFFGCDVVVRFASSLCLVRLSFTTSNGGYFSLCTTAVPNLRLRNQPKLAKRAG